MDSPSLAAHDDPGNRPWIAPFFAVIFAMMMLQMSNLGFSPLLPDIQTAFGLTYGQVGLFTGVYGLIGIVLSVPAGLLARKHGGETDSLARSAWRHRRPAHPDRCALVRRRARRPHRLAERLPPGVRVCVMMAAALTAPPKLKGSTMGIIGAVSGFASVIGAPFASEMGKAVGLARRVLAEYAVAALIGVSVFALLYRRVGSGVNSSTRTAAARRSLATADGRRTRHRWCGRWPRGIGPAEHRRLHHHVLRAGRGQGRVPSRLDGRRADDQLGVHRRDLPESALRVLRGSVSTA